MSVTSASLCLLLRRNICDFLYAGGEIFVLFAQKSVPFDKEQLCSHSAVADPDLYNYKVGGGVSKKNFFRPFRPQFGLKIRGAPPLDLPLLSLSKSCFDYYNINYLFLIIYPKFKIVSKRTAAYT